MSSACLSVRSSWYRNNIAERNCVFSEIIGDLYHVYRMYTELFTVRDSRTS